MKITKSTTLADLETLLTEMDASMEIERHGIGNPFTVIIHSRAKGAPEYAIKSKQTRNTNKSLITAARIAIEEHRG